MSVAWQTAAPAGCRSCWANTKRMFPTAGVKEAMETGLQEGPTETATTVTVSPGSNGSHAYVAVGALKPSDPVLKSGNALRLSFGLCPFSVLARKNQSVRLWMWLCRLKFLICNACVGVAWI